MVAGLSASASGAGAARFNVLLRVGPRCDAAGGALDDPWRAGAGCRLNTLRLCILRKTLQIMDKRLAAVIVGVETPTPLITTVKLRRYPSIIKAQTSTQS